MLSTQDLCDQEGLLVQFACSMQIIATGNQAIKPFFGADEILANGRVEIFPGYHRNLLKRMVGLGGLEPPTSPLSG